MLHTTHIHNLNMWPETTNEGINPFDVSLYFNTNL